MKTSLDRLPPKTKREELQNFVDIIRSNTFPKTDMIVLFDSHARGD